MSIQQVQTQNILDLVAKSFLAGGRSPLLDDIFKYVNMFFAQNTAGNPYQISKEFIGRKGIRSDPEFMNAIMATVITNIDTLYETCLQHIDQTLMLNTVLTNHLERLRIKRSVLNSKIDDYLLGIYNSDGYFYSYSDSLATITGADMAYTNAFIDTAAGAAMIPAVSSLSTVIDRHAVSFRSHQATNAEGETLPVTVSTLITDAFDGLNNTSWLMEVKTNDEGPIVLNVELQLSNQISDNLITKIDFEPHTVTPIQYGINAVYKTGTGTTTTVTEPFVNIVRTTASRCSFVSDHPKTGLTRLNIQMKKDKHDYEIDDAREKTLVYMFGFREIIISEQYFDPEARFVSKPIYLPEDYGENALIDAVSMTVTDSVPSGTSLTYYIAADNPTAKTLQDFAWVKIDPIGTATNLDTQIVRFDSTARVIRNIRLTPRNAGDLQQIAFNTTNVDLAKRNPTPAYFPGFDTYRIAGFIDNHIVSTLKLEEGFNTTRIHYTDLKADSLKFAFWEDVFSKPTSYKTVHGDIDTGHGFLYGADVGQNGQSIYSETYVHVTDVPPIILKECRKLDANSKTWAIKMFLNGKEIASLPVGMDNLTVPWKFQQGKNHVVVMAEIPKYTTATPAPYIGTFTVMTDTNLFDYGVVKLDDWDYVDEFKFKTNLTSNSKAFTIYRNEVISRKKPTDNFRLIFNSLVGSPPAAVRFRADFSRSNSFAHVTPILDFYRIRFSYTGGVTTSGD